MMLPARRAAESCWLALFASVFAATPWGFAQQEGAFLRLSGPGLPGSSGAFVLDGPTPMIREFGMGRFTELLRPDYMRRDSKLFAAVLELDSQQQVIIEVLLDDYVQSFDAAAAKLREAVRQAAPPLPQFARNFGDPSQLPQAIEGLIGDAIILPPPGTSPGEDVTVWQDADGVRAMRIITATGDGPASAPPPPLPPVEGATEVTREIQIESSPGAEPRVKVNIVAKGADGQNLIPPEVMQQLMEKIRARVEQRVREQMLNQEPGDGQKHEASEPALTTEQIASIARELHAEKIRLRQQFVTDAKLMLAESQLAQWGDLERTLRRDLSPLRSRLSGEQVNLRLIAERAVLQSIDPMVLDQLLDEYELQLDPVLRNRDEFLERSEIDSFIASREKDTDKRLALAEQEKSLRLAVRAANENVTEAIAQLIVNADGAAKFRHAVHETGYARVYRPTRTQRAFNQALALDDLAPETKQTIAAMHQQYESELAAANLRLVDITRQHEPDQPQRMIRFTAEMHRGEAGSFRPPEDPVSEGIEQRSNIGRRYLAQLRPLLTEQQLAKVPGASTPTFGQLEVHPAVAPAAAASN